MVVRRKKRSRKMRGGTSHGWGFSKRHRGKGSRGGHGHAGVGKRGAHNETKYLTLGISAIGSHGMRVKPRIIISKVAEINLKGIEENLNKWLLHKLIEKSADAYSIDLLKLGYAKLLADGRVTHKLNVKCKSCSAKAKQKVEAAGGTVSIT